MRILALTAVFLAAPVLPAAPKAKPRMLVSTAWLAQHLNDPSLVLLHVARDRKHYDEGHIPGARFLAWTELTRTRDGVPNELPPVGELKQSLEALGAGEGKRVVFYGDNNGLAATRAWFTMDYLGKSVMASVLDGGIEKWKAEKRSLATDAPAAPSQGRLLLSVRPDSVRSLQAVQDLSWLAANGQAGPLLIDARQAADFSAAHIPGAVNVFWGQQVASKEIPQLKPASELRKLYEAAGLSRGRKAVTYCMSGVQATHTYFVLRYLGYDAALYDGSLSEWKAKGAALAK